MKEILKEVLKNKIRLTIELKLLYSIAQKILSEDNENRAHILSEIADCEADAGSGLNEKCDEKLEELVTKYKSELELDLLPERIKELFAKEEEL